MEDDAELEDEESGDLLAEGTLESFNFEWGMEHHAGLLRVGRGRRFRTGKIFSCLCGGDAGVEAVVLISRVELVVGRSMLMWHLGAAAWMVGDQSFDVLMLVRETVFAFHVLLGTEVHEENEHDRG